MKKKIIPASLGLLTAVAALPVPAQQIAGMPVVTVTGQARAYADDPQYATDTAAMGPLGRQSVMDTPASVTSVPQDLIVNQQARTVNDVLRFLPSVEVRDQQGLEVSRPQARGFQGSVVQNTRLDGLNTVGTTAIAAENLDSIQVLNGVGGSLFGPQTPAGVFNYVLKRPTSDRLMRFVAGFDGKGVWTGQADLGGRFGRNGMSGYRLNAVHGQGESYVEGSHVERNLVAGDVDIHVDERTVIEADLSHYRTNTTGLPGSMVYDTDKGANTSTTLPGAPDPARIGYGQPGAGTDLQTDTGLVKIKHAFGARWNLEVGALYQDAQRGLYGITNTLLNDRGDYTVTRNFTAVPHYTIASNLVYLNGRVDLGGMRNDVSIGTNGFVNNQFNYKNSIAVTNPAVLNLANPQVLDFPATPAGGGEYKQGRLSEQSAILGDTLHLNPQWAVQGVASRSDIHAVSYDKTGKVTSRNDAEGLWSPTLSVIYKPGDKLSAYATAARSVEPGEQAPAGTANANRFLAPYHDKQVEVGAKYAAADNLLLTVAAFHMTRPLASTGADNLFAVAGTQTDNGLELFAQGKVRRDLSVFGGVTWIDAKLDGSANPATEDKLVVGVPRFKSDVVLDYHPDYAAGVSLTGALHYASRRAATNTNNAFAPSYLTLDAGLRYATAVMAHHHAALRLQVLNATDRHYYASVADGNIVGSRGANTAYLAAPRTVTASLELDY
jgi:iron complex outermembrane receptor protein